MRGKKEECFIFGWRLFNFYWKNGPFQGSLKQLGLGIVSSIASIAKGDRLVRMSVDFQLWEMKCRLICP